MNDEQGLLAIKRKWRPTHSDHLRDYFCSKPFDQTLGVYYPKVTIEKYNLTSAKRTLDFTRWIIEQSGYRGWYAVVVHDKRGSTLWHPHMLLDGRNDQFNKLKRAAFKFADVNYKTSGPVIDLRSCAGYMAMRAFENDSNSEITWELEFMGQPKKHRPRGSRGRGHGKASCPRI